MLVLIAVIHEAFPFQKAIVKWDSAADQQYSQIQGLEKHSSKLFGLMKYLNIPMETF